MYLHPRYRKHYQYYGKTRGAGFLDVLKKLGKAAIPIIKPHLEPMIEDLKKKGTEFAKKKGVEILDNLKNKLTEPAKPAAGSGLSVVSNSQALGTVRRQLLGQLMNSGYSSVSQSGNGINLL